MKRQFGCGITKPVPRFLEATAGTTLLAVALAGLLVGCSRSDSAQPPVSATTPANTATTTSPPAVARTDSAPQPVLANVGLASPENLVYDAQDSVFLVANMNGGPRTKDANGFVSRVSPDGRMVTLKWIDGSHAGTRLDAPKGLAIRGDTLAIADVGCVRLFSLRTGASLGVWNLPGVMMNDLSYAPDGTLYVTDTGPDSGKTATTDHAAVFHFATANHPSQVIAGADLSGPDGIVASDTGFVFATFGANRVETVSKSGARKTLASLPGGKVDGLRRLADGSFVVTSWDAHSVFRMTPGGTLTTIVSGITSPAGVAYDADRHQLAVTSMNDNSMYLVNLQ